jgi:hypothetical protein
MLIPIAFAYTRGGKIHKIMVRAPFKIPKDPIPVIALPIINIGDI